MKALSSEVDPESPVAVRIWLDGRRAEIESAVLDRVFSISDPSAVADPAYVESLRGTVSVAIDYALEAIDRGEGRTPPPPPALLAQARLAARSGVGLDTVLRRYMAGYTLLGEILGNAADRDNRPGSTFAQLLPGRAAILDRLLAAVSEEYEREARLRPSSTEGRRVERIERLLAGEPIDTSDLAYDFDACHLGIVSAGEAGAQAIKALGRGLDHRVLIVRAGTEAVWGWLAGRRPPSPDRVAAVAENRLPPGCSLSVGEPAAGIAGWRLTYRQASAASRVALHGPPRVVRYADVAFLAAALGDDLLATSLEQIYLTPLRVERDEGRIAMETLRAYFRARGNITSAAAALGVRRHTVARRLQECEDRIGRDLSGCGAEIETALRLAELRRTSWSGSASPADQDGRVGVGCG